MNGSNPTPNHNEGDTVEVDDIHHFVAITTSWHAKKVAVLQHMLQVPAGTEMTTEGGTEVVLEGAFLDGFKAGLGLALMELGILPFAAEVEDDPAQPAANDESKPH